MKIKTRNLAELVMQVIILILIFIPGVYQSVFYQIGTDSSSVSLGSWTRQSATETMVSFWSKNISFTTVTRICVWAFLIFAVIGLILYVIQFLGKNLRANLKVCIPFPVLELIAFIIPTFFDHTSRGVSGNYTSYTSYSPSFLFYVMIALIIVLALVTYIGYTMANKSGITGSVDSIADEVKKYKELYDEGAITKAEYEQKKRQLLNSDYK